MPSEPTLTAAELAMWQAATDAATPGPWRSDLSEDWGIALAGDTRVADFGDISVSAACDMSKRDAAFVALAREAMPRLLAEVREHRQDWVTHRHDYDDGKKSGYREGLACAANAIMQYAVTVYPGSAFDPDGQDDRCAHARLVRNICAALVDTVNACGDVKP